MIKIEDVTIVRGNPTLEIGKDPKIMKDVHQEEKTTKSTRSRYLGFGWDFS